MLAEKLARILLPAKLYTGIKQKFRRFRNNIHPKLSEEKFREILTHNLKVKKGSVVFIHSSISNLYLDFPYHKVLTILLELVGEEGTLLFPCNHLRIRAEDYLRKNEIFDVRRSPSTMGLLSELARRYKNSIRSLHPTNSVVAIGKYAKELTMSHCDSIYPTGEESPYYKIVHYNGIIIGLGVDVGEILSFVHCPEDILMDRFPVQTRLDEIFVAKVIDFEGKERMVTTLAAHPNTRYIKLAKFIRKYIPRNICYNIKVNGVKFYYADSKLLYDRMEELALKGITIYSKKAKLKPHL